MGGFKSRDFRDIEKRIDCAPERAPRYACRRHDVVSDVSNAIRWSLHMAPAWDGQERTISAMAGVEGVIVVAGFLCTYARARARIQAEVEHEQILNVLAHYYLALRSACRVQS